MKTKKIIIIILLFFMCTHLILRKSYISERKKVYGIDKHFYNNYDKAYIFIEFNLNNKLTVDTLKQNLKNMLDNKDILLRYYIENNEIKKDNRPSSVIVNERIIYTNHPLNFFINSKIKYVWNIFYNKKLDFYFIFNHTVFSGLQAIKIIHKIKHIEIKTLSKLPHKRVVPFFSEFSIFYTLYKIINLKDSKLEYCDNMEPIILKYNFKFIKNGDDKVTHLINAKILNWFFKLNIFSKLSFLNICAFQEEKLTQFNNIAAVFNEIKNSNYNCILNQLKKQKNYKYLANGTGLLCNLLESDIAFFNKKIDIHITSMPIYFKNVNVKKIIIPNSKVPILICNIKNNNKVFGFIQIKTKQFDYQKLMNIINSEKKTSCIKIDNVSFNSKYKYFY